MLMLIRNKEPTSMVASSYNQRMNRRQTCRSLLALAATAALATPVVSLGDLVAWGHAAQLGRPAGRVTGISFLPFPLNAKRLELLAQTLPRGSAVLNLAELQALPEAIRMVEDAGRAQVVQER